MHDLLLQKASGEKTLFFFIATTNGNEKPSCKSFNSREASQAK